MCRIFVLERVWTLKDTIKVVWCGPPWFERHDFSQSNLSLKVRPSELLLKRTVKENRFGGRHSSIVLSASFILRPVFESQAPHLCFSNLHYWNCHEKGTKKQAGIGPFKKENSFTIRWHGMLQENIRCWGKYHCTTGLQVDKFGFNWFTTKRYKKQHSILFGGLQSC